MDPCVFPPRIPENMVCLWLWMGWGFFKSRCFQTGGFFGMPKENKYIQKGWGFNPREVVKNCLTNSCADSTSPLSGRFSAISAFAYWHLETSRSSWSFCRGWPVEESYTNRVVPWQELKFRTDAGSAAVGERGKTKPLASYTHADSSHKALLLLLFALRKAFPAFQSSALNTFPLWPLQNTPSYSRELQQISVACKGPSPSKPFWHLNQMLPSSPSSQWLMFLPFIF